jgi:hypothetical protein
MFETTSQFDLAQLPLILAGPILRRVEPESVTVWLALQNFYRQRLNRFSQSADVIGWHLRRITKKLR